MAADRPADALLALADKLHGAAAALSPTGAGMGQVDGYTAADYLIQHASRERRHAPVPASTWDAIVSHVHDPADTVRLGDSARNRLVYRYAIPLYRDAADAGDRLAAWRLADLLEKRGDPDGAIQVLRAWADAGDDDDAAVHHARLLVERGDLDGAEQILDGAAPLLRAQAGADDRFAASTLADLLARRGDLDGAEQILHAEQVVRASADAGDSSAAWRLADLLAERGDLDGAIQVLQARADVGDDDAAVHLAGLLVRRGDLAGAVQVLQARADVGDWNAARLLADLLVKQGRSEEAEQLRRFGLNPDGSIACA